MEVLPSPSSMKPHLVCSKWQINSLKYQISVEWQDFFLCCYLLLVWTQFGWSFSIHKRPLSVAKNTWHERFWGKFQAQYQERNRGFLGVVEGSLLIKDEKGEHMVKLHMPLRFHTNIDMMFVHAVVHRLWQMTNWPSWTSNFDVTNHRTHKEPFPSQYEAHLPREKCCFATEIYWNCCSFMLLGHHFAITYVQRILGYYSNLWPDRELLNATN